MSTPTMAPTSLPRAATFEASSRASSRRMSRPMAVSLTEMLASMPRSWMRSMAARYELVDSRAWASDSVFSPRKSSATDIPPAFSARIACSASSRVLPAMNRSATRRAIGFAVTCRCRNAEPAAFSNVALSMAPTIPRERRRSGPRSAGRQQPGGCGQPRAPSFWGGLRSPTGGPGARPGGCSLLGGRGRLDGFDVPAVAADEEDDGDEHGGEDEGGHGERGDGDGVGDGGDDGGGGDGEDPGPDDAAGDAPADRGEAAGRADADDRAGDGVGGGDGDAEEGGQVQGAGGGGLGREAADRLEGGDPLAEGLDDPPAARERPERDRRVGGDRHPERDRQVAVRLQLEVAGADQQGADDPHGLLGVVAAVAETEGGRRDELEAAEQAVDPG